MSAGYCTGHTSTPTLLGALPEATIQGKTPACQRAVLSVECYSYTSALITKFFSTWRIEETRSGSTGRAGPPLCPSLMWLPHSSRLFEGWEPMFSGHRNLLRLLLLFFNDAATSPLLRRWVPALYHFQLLSPTGATRLGSPPQAVSRNSGAGSPPLQICRGRICDYARAFPPADPRAGAGQSRS